MLIDTHILIWILENKLTSLGSEALKEIKLQQIIVSVATLMEIASKKRKGKLDAPETETIANTLQKQDIAILDIQSRHIFDIPGLASTPHADPFDLLLIAQAISENIPLLTCNAEILKVVHPGLRLIDGRR